MKLRRSHRLFSLLAVFLALTLLALMSTTALADRPTPPQPWKGVTDGGNSQEYPDPNAPENLKNIVASASPVRVVIQLAEPPVAQYRGGIQNLAPARRDAKGKIVTASSEAAAYISHLAQQQATFRRALTGVAPNANVQYQYQIAFNGVVAKLPGNTIPAIKKLAGVKGVTVARRYTPMMDASLQLIGLYSGLEDTGTDQGMWTQVGGHSQAGQGIKIADIDTGIDQTHAFFNPAGFSYPSGFPKGDTAYTTPKVIVARAYFRPDSPPDTTVDCACPKDYIGHGSHTAGTMAGRYGTDTPFGVKISGVAPQAYLMNYKIFYTNSKDGLQYSETPEQLMAIEDVIRDGADVVNNSWGGLGLDYATDPTIAAFNAAMDAGITVVFSAGNEGPSANSIGNPGNGQRFITVGASTTNRLFGHRVDVSLGDATVTNLFGVISTGPAFSADVGPAAYVDSKFAARAAGATQAEAEIGCAGMAPPYSTPYAANAFAGKIALIKRGGTNCTFLDKVQNATAAGAIGVVIWNNTSGAPTTMAGLETTTVPSVMVSNGDGLALRGWLTGHAGAQLKIAAAISRGTDDGWQDMVASFSSKGPSTTWQIKPDLVAPGVNILSSVPYGTKFDLYQGTSMAAPHVTGVAALVKQLHGDWTPAQIKSAIMSTAQLPASLDSSCDALGYPYPGPLCRGSGRLFAGYPAGPGDPGLTFDMPSISVGTQFAGGTFPMTVNAKNVGAAGTYNITIDETVPGANLTITRSAASLTFAANETKPFAITFAIGATTPRKDYYGMIHVNNTDGVHNLNIPYWVRVLPAFVKTPGATVLLIDDDFSRGGYTDYRGAYTAALTGLGITYDVIETLVETPGLACASPWETASKYSKAILFTGDNGGILYQCDFGVQSPNIYGMNNYLAGGGRLLMIGQDAAAGLSYGDDRDSDLMLYFGAHYIQDNVFDPGLPPKPSAQGVGGSSPFLNGVEVDFSAGGDGAGNQGYVDELDAVNFTDVDAAALFKAHGTGYSSTGMVGTRMSSEPTIERVSQNPRTLWTRLGYRTELLSFGLEGVNNNTSGSITRENLLARLLGFLDDNISVAFNAPSYSAAGLSSPATLTANATTSVTSAGGFTNGIEYYRWSFGDGSALVVTSGNSASHSYAASGSYKAYVEVKDKFGHKAVAGPVTVEVGSEVPISGLTISGGGVKRLGTPATLEATIGGGTHVTYSWDLGDGQTAIGAAVTHTYAKTGRYTVTVTATNAAGTATVSTTVQVVSVSYLPLVGR